MQTSEVLIRNVQPRDLDECCAVETYGFSPEEAAARETIKLRIETFPQGFFVAEVGGRVIGMTNGACTNKEDISDEELKQLIGHDPDGKNMVIFALAVLPEFQKRGIAKRLVQRFVEEARRNKKEKVFLMCKQHLIVYYKGMGFDHVGLSRSTHGGSQWHEMRLSLRK
jgi:ribosomal protein S18 acetylase RimI-like enzyme